MHPLYEQYQSNCQMISLLTNLDVQVFDNEHISQIHCAHYDLPDVIEGFKQAILAQIFQQPLAKDSVYIFRDAIHLEFLTTGIWDEAEYRGTIVVGPYISTVFHPQLLRATIQKEQLPIVMQRQLHQCYNSLILIDDAKQYAISRLLITTLKTDTLPPQLIEATVPPPENTAVKFHYNLEEKRALIEQRYAAENKTLHAIEKGDKRLLAAVMEEWKGLPWPYRHPNSPVRSMKNLSLSHNTLCRKAAEHAGVHPLYLDSVSGKFAIQIEQAQNITELTSLYEEMLQIYCDIVRALAITALPPLIKEAVTSIRFNIDQPLSLQRVADMLGVHPSYLSRAFKKEMGVTLTGYINKLRVEEAKYVLDHGNTSIIAAALSVGYNDPNYFSKVFHKLEHITPHEYKKRKPVVIALPQ